MTDSEKDVLTDLFGYRLGAVSRAGKAQRSYRSGSREHKAADKLAEFGLVTVHTDPNDDYFVIVSRAA